MGLRLSEDGNLTYSQSHGLSKQDQAKLLERLSKLPVNQEIFKKIEEKRRAKQERAAQRAAAQAETSVKKGKK